MTEGIAHNTGRLSKQGDCDGDNDIEMVADDASRGRGGGHGAARRMWSLAAMTNEEQQRGGGHKQSNYFGLRSNRFASSSSWRFLPATLCAVGCIILLGAATGLVHTAQPEDIDHIGPTGKCCPPSPLVPSILIITLFLGC